MSRELEQLDYEDALVNLNSVLERYGCRQVMTDFRDAFPQMFPELIVQLARLQENKTIPVLFLPKPHADPV